MACELNRALRLLGAQLICDIQGSAELYVRITDYDRIYRNDHIDDIY